MCEWIQDYKDNLHEGMTQKEVISQRSCKQCQNTECKLRDLDRIFKIPCKVENLWTVKFQDCGQHPLNCQQCAFPYPPVIKEGKKGCYILKITQITRLTKDPFRGIPAEAQLLPISHVKHRIKHSKTSHKPFKTKQITLF